MYFISVHNHLSYIVLRSVWSSESVRVECWLMLAVASPTWGIAGRPRWWGMLFLLIPVITHITKTKRSNHNTLEHRSHAHASAAFIATQLRPCYLSSTPSTLLRPFLTLAAILSLPAPQLPAFHYPTNIFNTSSVFFGFICLLIQKRDSARLGVALSPAEWRQTHPSVSPAGGGDLRRVVVNSRRVAPCCAPPWPERAPGHTWGASRGVWMVCSRCQSFLVLESGRARAFLILVRF